MKRHPVLLPPGWGGRLRAERQRLGLTQTELAELAGVQRLSQGQYEAESREPRVSYLSAAAAAGVDVQFVLFGRRTVRTSETETSGRSVEQQAFEMVEEYVRTKCAGALSAEGRYVLFDVMRSSLLATLEAGAVKTPALAEGGEMLDAAGGETRVG